MPEFLMVIVPLALAGPPFCPHHQQLSSGFRDRDLPQQGLFFCPGCGSKAAKTLSAELQVPSEVRHQALPVLPSGSQFVFFTEPSQNGLCLKEH